MHTGFKNMAERIELAQSAFIATLQSFGGIDAESATRVFAYYRKHKLVKRDAVVGVYNVVHGSFLDREIIRRAVELA